MLELALSDLVGPTDNAVIYNHLHSFNGKVKLVHSFVLKDTKIFLPEHLNIQDLFRVMILYVLRLLL